MPYQALSLHEFASKYASVDACLSALMDRRWPDGWKCLSCGGVRHYRLHSRRALQCANRSCRKQISVTSGSVFEQMKIPMPKIFLAIYLMTNKQGISARSLSKLIDVAYDTAFNLLHKVRAAMSNHDTQYLLSGHVQMDESYLGGHTDKVHLPGRSRSTKRVVGVAVEQRGPNQSGFIHLEALPSASSESLHGMILEKIKKGSQLHTDAWTGYQGIAAKGYDHQPVKSPGGMAASRKWPLVHRAASNLCSWLMGTHKQFCTTYLNSYLAEYCWRTNRRNRTKDEFASNSREATLPDRLMTLIARQPYISARNTRLRHAA